MQFLYPSGERIRPVEVPVIRGIEEKTAAALYLVDDRGAHFCGNSRAAFAASQGTPPPDMIFTDIGRGMHDDCALQGMVVPSFFHSFQAQRIAVLPHKRPAGEIESQAAHIAAELVGEPRGHQLTRIPSMRDKGVE